MPQQVESAADSFEDWVWEVCTKAQELRDVEGGVGCWDAQRARFGDAIVGEFVGLSGVRGG